MFEFVSVETDLFKWGQREFKVLDKAFNINLMNMKRFKRVGRKSNLNHYDNGL